MQARTRFRWASAVLLVLMVVVAVPWVFSSRSRVVQFPQAGNGSLEPVLPGTRQAKMEQQAEPVATSQVFASAATRSMPGASPTSFSSAMDLPVSSAAHVLASEEASYEEPEQVVLLDGGTGPRPANLMNCIFDGGTYRCGDCTTSSDCPAGQGCVINYGKGLFECVSSECEEDAHCFPGQVCRIAAGSPPGPVIRRCLLAGQRAEGETCSRLPATQAEACQEGLLCVNHLCGRPCVPGTPESCPEGLACLEGPSGSACLPDCRKSGCPADRQCAQLNGGNFQCLHLVVDECDERKPCPEGKSCLVRGRAGRAGRFCVSPCESWRPESCPRDFVCGLALDSSMLSACYRTCDPQDLSTCPSGWLCTTVSEDLQTWGCLPNFH